MNEEHKPTARVLDILELLASDTSGFTLTEIASAIQAAKGTIFPVIRTLCQRKFILQDPATGKYHIGISAFCVGESYATDKSVMQFFQEEMHSIVDQVGEICQLGILDKGEVLYIAKEDNQEAIRLISHVGKRLPAYCTALGKALLSEYSIDKIEEFYPHGLKPMTEHTITSFLRMDKELHEIRRTHLAHEHEECTNYLSCIAIPLKSEGHVVAALSVSVPTFRMSEGKAKQIEDVLLYEKKKIETYLTAEHFRAEDFIFNYKTENNASL